MARARNIKPGFFSNYELAQCGIEARIMFAGLWTVADRSGRLLDRPQQIKLSTLPYDDCDPDKILQLLHAAGFIQRYCVNGIKYIQVSNWDKHQNPHIKEQTSTIPAPDLHCADTMPEPDKNGSGTEVAGLIPDSGFLIPDSLSSDSIENPLAQKSLRDWVTPGGKWTSDECKAFLKHHHWTPAKPELLCDLITEIDPLKLPDEEDDPDSLAGILARLIQFDIAWEEMYWLKADKKKARIAWLKATRSIEMVRVIQDAIEAQAPAMLKREPRHRPHMATWLNGERWRDELPSGGEEGRSAWGLH